MSDWSYGELFQFGSVSSCVEIIKRICEDILGNGQEQEGQIVEGSITPVIDDPARLLPAKEKAE